MELNKMIANRFSRPFNLVDFGNLPCAELPEDEYRQLWDDGLHLTPVGTVGSLIRLLHCPASRPDVVLRFCAREGYDRMGNMAADVIIPLIEGMADVPH